MESETFNQKCDRILNYLNDKPNRYVELLSWENFTSETGISKKDYVIEYLYKERKFIDCTMSSVSISSLGAAFISHNSFCKIQEALDTKQSLEWYNREDAKQRFDDYPTVKKQRDVAYGIAILGVVLTIISLIIALVKHKQ